MASYYLTRRAALDLRKINAFSIEKWGKAIANAYISDLYHGFQRAADNPAAGKLRQSRSAPFSMISAREHFIVFEPVYDGVIILTILHKARDVEMVISTLEASFVADLVRLQKQIKSLED